MVTEGGGGTVGLASELYLIQFLKAAGQGFSLAKWRCWWYKPRCSIFISQRRRLQFLVLVLYLSTACLLPSAWSDGLIDSCNTQLFPEYSFGMETAVEHTTIDYLFISVIIFVLLMSKERTLYVFSRNLIACTRYNGSTSEPTNT